MYEEDYECELNATFVCNKCGEERPNFDRDQCPDKENILYRKVCKYCTGKLIDHCKGCLGEDCPCCEYNPNPRY